MPLGRDKWWGLLLNNQLTDFSFVAEKEGKLIAIVLKQASVRAVPAPTIVLDTDAPVLAIGSWGSRIIGYVAQSLLAILDQICL